MRADLTPGQQLAQSIHAAGESAVDGPIPDKTVALALAATDRAHLLKIAARLQRARIPHTLIVECDGEPMAIGIHPTRDRKTLRKVTGALPLAGRDFNCIYCHDRWKIERDLRTLNDKQLQEINRLQKQLHKLTQVQPAKPWWRRIFSRASPKEAT